MELLSLFAQVDQVAEKVSFTNQWWFTLLMLIAIIAISFFAGRVIARNVKIQEHGWKLSLIFFCVLFSAYYVSDNWPPKFGVDLKGGVTFIVDLNLDNDPELVVDKWLGYDKNGDQILDADEVPQDRRAEWAVMDKDDDSAVSVDEVRAKANRDAKENGANQESVENVIDQLKKRIDPSGIYEVDLRALGNDQIEITIPGVEPGAEADRILDRIKKAGYLQFRILARKTEEEHAATIDAAMAQASGLNMDLRGRSEVRSAGGSGDSLLGRWVNVGLLDAERSRQLKLKTRPYRYTLPFNQQMGVNVLVRNSATGEIINQIPSMPEGLNPDSPEGVRFLQNPKLLSAYLADWWNEKYITEFPNARMQILVIEPPEKENVEGGDLVPNLVRSTTDRTGRPAVEFTLKKEGVPKFSRLTGNNIGRSLGMILDGELLSAPNISSKIFKNGIIEGDFTSKEVRDLISILKAGQLRTTLQSPDGGGDLIDSTMGQEMKDRGFWAIGASFVLILGFLVVYYQIAGIVSCLALILNMTMILTVIMMLGQPLTLNGLAGLVLTVGMSVDANVLIFERIREELSKDATLRMAIRNGFQRATTTIVDANITTFITAFILYVIGNEQLKSFSVALMLGIVLSMFTAIFCSRVLFDVFEKKRWLKNLGGARLFTNSNINFVGKRSVAFVFSAIFIAVGIGAIFARGGTMLNHDLAGGSMAKVVFSEATPLEDINQVLRKIESKTMVNDSQAEISVAELTSDLYPS
ncbi:MAG: protein translocase subunit SecD, partial [Pirellulaceae bacterium]|nr:protein translocase subunit SecD [Pirellulaceae bacterium]